ncbi:MAG: caspase family protein [Planctomycetota bacterium]|nr:caspase family protein [Planctomycetota bacterium]
MKNRSLARHSRWLLVLLSILLTACTSIAAPKSLKTDTAFLDQFRGQSIENHLLIAPIVTEYQSRDFAEAALEDPKATYRPSLSSTEQKTLTDKVRDALSAVFTEPVDVLASLPGDGSSSSLFRQAEDRGAQLLMTGTLLENRVSYNGYNIVGWFFDVHSLFGFPPSHWWIPDERFSVIRCLRLRFYDVRLPKEALYEVELTGESEQTLNEWQHGIVPFNPVRALFDNGERFGVSQWKTVYKGLADHADRDLQNNLLREMVTGLRPLLKSPTIRKRLENGDPAQARVYSILIGQNYGSTKRAVTDAEAFAKVCQSRLGTETIHSKLITGPVQAKNILATVAKLRVKAVDRLIVYYSGQGLNDVGGQSLLLSGGERLPLSKLAEALKKLKTKKISIILDTSFGDSKRARVMGGRTAAGSRPGTAQSPFLRPLLEDSWQLMCAAKAGQTTGEVDNHGLLTGFLLSVIQKDKILDFQALHDEISSRYSRRSHALLGGQHQLFLKVSQEKLDESKETSQNK